MPLGSAPDVLLILDKQLISRSFKRSGKKSLKQHSPVFCIWGRDERDEASRFADLTHFLKANGVIEDYSQVALLLHSVREEHSGSYLTALKARAIPAFCPRARAYFENEEIRLLVACFAVLFGWYGQGVGKWLVLWRN